MLDSLIRQERQEKILQSHYKLSEIGLTVYKHLIIKSFPDEIRLGTLDRDLLDEVKEDLLLQGLCNLEVHNQALDEIRKTFETMEIYKPVLNEKYTTPTMFRVQSELPHNKYVA